MTQTATPERQAIGREPPEWIGRDASTPVPKKVKLRVFRRYGGRCYLTGARIRAGDAWDVEHIKPIWLDPTGNREGNLAPALKAPHGEKSAREAGERAKTDRIAEKHFGLHKSPHGMRKHPTLKRGLDGKVRPRFSKTSDPETDEAASE